MKDFGGDIEGHRGVHVCREIPRGANAPLLPNETLVGIKLFNPNAVSLKSLLPSQPISPSSDIKNADEGNETPKHLIPQVYQMKYH